MPGRFELDYIFGGVVTYPPGATFGPRELSDYEFVWIVQGDVILRVNDQPIAAPAGSVILTRPGFRDGYTWDPRRASRHAFFHFTFTNPPEDWPSIDRWPVCQMMPDHDIIRPLFRYILGNLRTRGRQTRPGPMIDRAVETLLGAYLVGPRGQGGEHERGYPEPVARAFAYVRDTLGRDPASPITLADLAAAASVSQEHLCRVFRSSIGAGPMETVRLLRLDVAIGLLARSNLNIEQVAYRCGFASPFHFSRRVKEVYGASPRDLRKRMESGHPPPQSPLVKTGLMGV